MGLFTTWIDTRLKPLLVEIKSGISNSIPVTSIIDTLTSTDTTKPLSAAQGKVLKDLIDSINTLLTSDNVNLDTIQEIVDYIENHESDINSLLSGKINTTDIVDTVTSTDATKPLSAAQGKVLKDLIDNLASSSNVVINSLTSTDTTNALSAAQGKILKDVQDTHATEIADIQSVDLVAYWGTI